MKRTIQILLLLGALLTAGCVRNDDGVGSEVEFDTVVHNTTKAILDGSVLPTTEQFKVYGYYSNDSFVNTATYIDGENVGYVNTDNVWRCQSATTYYWPISGKMKFYAYYPVTISPAPTVNSSTGVSISAYQITSTNIRDDVLYATNTVDCPPAQPAVPLSFSHALAQVCFTAQLAEEYSVTNNTVEIAINSISLNNIFSTGNFQQNPMGWKDQKSLQAYTVLSGVSAPIDYVGAHGTPVSVGEAVLMIPQTLSDAASLTVNYTVKQLAGTPNEYSSPQTATVSIKSHQWLVNRKVTYNLKVKLDTIEFDVTDGEWGSTTGGEIVV